MKHNPVNERIKRQYFIFLKDAKGQNSASIDGVAMALSRFEKYNGHKDFKRFHFEQAVGFKKYLAKQLNSNTNKPLSKATLNTTLRHLKVFFQWICLQPGYKSRLNYADMEYFNLSEKETRVANARREQRVPTIEQVEHVIESMPANTVVERRNRALIAFTLLTGARDAAIASFRLKHIDLDNQRVIHDAREVKVKFSKTFNTYFFPVSEQVVEIVIEWVEYLRSELLYGNDDPLFPKTTMRINGRQEFEVSGVGRECWSTAGPIRKVFKKAFADAGVEAFNPHSFRKTLVTLGEQVCKTPEEFKAWSQNLGHEQVLTTFTSYGEVQPQKQSEIFKELRTPKEEELNSIQQIAEAVAKEMRKQGNIFTG
jgi:integrase